jgi:hypothetical protein
VLSGIRACALAACSMMSTISVGMYEADCASRGHRFVSIDIHTHTYVYTWVDVDVLSLHKSLQHTKAQSTISQPSASLAHVV